MTDMFVLRGGSWFNYDPSYFRCAYRNGFQPSGHDSFIGFRVARTQNRKANSNMVNVLDMIMIPGGKFTNGRGREVALAAYKIGKNEVTNAEFAAFVEATSYDAGSEWRGYAEKNGPTCPVVCVNNADAEAYCAWAGGRLPTENEWEYAATGGDGRQYPWGNEWDATRCCNSAGSRRSGPMPVGSFPEGASPFGCLDMAGNVWERTSSKW